MNVDHTEKSPIVPRVLSFCTGARGIEEGLERVFGRISELAYVEIEAIAITNLVAEMEAGTLVPTPIWTDLKTFPAEIFRGKVDIITGGYPCQPFSMAGKRKGKEDPRHLWPFIRNHIESIRPVCCFFENVSGHLSMGYDEVYRDLRDLGYAVEGDLFTASEIGAPHERERLFILAVENTYGSRTRNLGEQISGRNREENVRQENGKECSIWIESTGKLAHAKNCHVGRCNQESIEGQKQESQESCSGTKLANTKNHRCKRKEKTNYEEREILRTKTELKSDLWSWPKRLGRRWPSRPGEAQYEWEEPRTVGNTTSKRNKFVRKPKRKRSKIKVRRSGSKLRNPKRKSFPLRKNRTMGKPIKNKKYKRSGSKYSITAKRKIEPWFCREFNGIRSGLDTGILVEYTLDKVYASRVLLELRKTIDLDSCKWDYEVFWDILCSRVFWSGLLWKVLPRRISEQFAKWRESEEMWYKGLGITWESEPTDCKQLHLEQFALDIEYALCIISHEIALACGENTIEYDPEETLSIREMWNKETWCVSGIIPEIRKIWEAITCQEMRWQIFFSAYKNFKLKLFPHENRIDRLRMCGNGVVPDVVELAFVSLWNKLYDLNFK